MQMVPPVSGCGYARDLTVCQVSGQRTMSCWGMPSVMQTMRSRLASTPSRMACAANGGGTYNTDAVAPVSFTASCRAAIVEISHPAGRSDGAQGLITGLCRTSCGGLVCILPPCAESRSTSISLPSCKVRQPPIMTLAEATWAWRSSSVSLMC